jgi:hypothetical protein
LERLPLLVGVRVIVPESVGVIVKVWATAEFENTNTVGDESPPPLGVMVIVPLYALSGVTVKLVDALLTEPDDGPVKVKVVAGGIAGVTLFEALDALPVPALLVAVTVNVYGVPLVSPVTVIGEALPVAVMPFGAEVTV